MQKDDKYDIELCDFTDIIIAVGALIIIIWMILSFVNVIR